MKIKASITGIMILFFCNAKAENFLTIEYLDGETAKEQLANVSKIVFDSDENISLNLNDGYEKDYGKISDVQKIVFMDIEKMETHLVRATSMKIYPNPSTETISIEGLEDGQIVHIYSISGKLEQTSKESAINVSNLSNGEHIVVAGNLTAKIVKK